MSEMSYRKRMKLAISLFLICLIFLLDLLLGNIFIPIPQHIPNEYYHHTLRNADFKGNMMWGKEKYLVFTNSLGFKDSSNRKISLIPGRKRILFIGDSFTEGVGLPYEKTFVGLIGEAIKDKVEVLNATTTSYSPKLYHLKAKYLLEKVGLRFDELYVYIDISDIPDEIIYENFMPYKDPLLIKALKAINRFFIRRSFLYYNFHNRILPRTPRGKYYKERSLWVDDEKVFEGYKKGLKLAGLNMEKLQDLCKKYNVKMTIAVFPHPEQIKGTIFNLNK